MSAAVVGDGDGRLSRVIVAGVAQSVDEKSDHALRAGVILRGHAQACDGMQEFIGLNVVADLAGGYRGVE